MGKNYIFPGFTTQGCNKAYLVRQRCGTVELGIPRDQRYLTKVNHCCLLSYAWAQSRGRSKLSVGQVRECYKIV